jgi:DMSO/TMAO reductase YedYZ heme-binding membrane subunit
MELSRSRLSEAAGAGYSHERTRGSTGNAADFERGVSVPRGWAIVGWCAVAIALMATALLAVAGSDEAGLRLVIRATARTSVVLFTLAFAASALCRRWPRPATRWLLANRRHLGVSFAVSHLVHLLAILALTGWSPRAFLARAGLAAGAFGVLGYAFLAAMVATSFDATAARLGPRWWRRLHLVGAHWLWLVFFASFAPRTAESPLLYGPLAALLLAALALRLSTRNAG